MHRSSPVRASTVGQVLSDRERERESTVSPCPVSPRRARGLGLVTICSRSLIDELKHTLKNKGNNQTQNKRCTIRTHRRDKLPSTLLPGYFGGKLRRLPRWTLNIPFELSQRQTAGFMDTENTVLQDGQDRTFTNFLAPPRANASVRRLLTRMIDFDDAFCHVP